MRNLTKMLSVPTLTLALAACAETAAHKTGPAAQAPAPAPAAMAPAPAAPPEVALEDLEGAAAVTMTATVQAIDLATRTVTLRGPSGRTATIHVDERVKNLPQVKVGDRVVVDYYESVALELLKPGATKVRSTVEGGVATAAPGQLPAGIAAIKATLVAKVTKVNRHKPSATLQGPKGRQVEVRLKDPAVLDDVKVGDEVQVTYLEAVAIAVEKPAKAAKKSAKSKKG